MSETKADEAVPKAAATAPNSDEVKKNTDPAQ